MRRTEGQGKGAGITTVVQECRETSGLRLALIPFRTGRRNGRLRHGLLGQSGADQPD